MGWNTTVVVLNDALEQIKNDPSFGKKLAAACSHRVITDGPVDVSAGNHCNAAAVIETHHADVTKVVLVGGNYGEDLGPAWLPGNDEPKELRLARALAEEHGYHLRKNPSKK